MEDIAGMIVDRASNIPECFVRVHGLQRRVLSGCTVVDLFTSVNRCYGYLHLVGALHARCLGILVQL